MTFECRKRATDFSSASFRAPHLRASSRVATSKRQWLQTNKPFGRMASVPFENGRHIVPVAAIRRKRRKPPPALRQFHQFLRQTEPGNRFNHGLHGF
jgi:hypothetical protein